MDPVLLASITQAAGNTSGGIMNAWSTSRQNKKSRQWSEKMYARQTKDNLDFWNKQNAYNHPKAQFDRMLQSGLNPKLMYEKGTTGQAGPITTPDLQPVENRVPEFGSALSAAGGVLSAHYDLGVKNAQSNLLDQQAKYQNIQTAISEIEKTFLPKLNESQIAKIKGDTKYISDKNLRELLGTASNLNEAAQRIERSIEEGELNDQRLKNLKKSWESIDKDVQWKQIKIDTGDSNWLQIMQALYKYLSEPWESAGSSWGPQGSIRKSNEELIRNSQK